MAWLADHFVLAADSEGVVGIWLLMGNEEVGVFSVGCASSFTPPFFYSGT